MISGTSVLKHEFRTSRGGYDQVAVDEFLDEIVLSLRAYEGGVTPSPGSVDSHAVEAVRFESVGRWRVGYEPQDVETFLAQVSNALRTYETGGTPRQNEGELAAKAPSDAVPKAQPVASSTPSAVQENKRKGFFSR